MEHGDAVPSQWPFPLLGIENRQVWGLEEVTTLEMLSSRAVMKHCKGGTIYPIIYTQMLKMSTRTEDPRAATAVQVL